MSGTAVHESEGTIATIADRYTALERVGMGGTAVVYRCRDDRTGRIVAVKVLRSMGSQIPEAGRRFYREARLAASLSHRHIVRVLDYGLTRAPGVAPTGAWGTDDDQPVQYVAMEYIFGPNLKEVVRSLGPLPLNWVWDLGDQLCSALQAAHDKGVVHRDVKPQNVMLVDSHIELLAKLTDFGIARQVDGDYTTLTVTGQVLGTPDYLSPEQVAGEAGDHQSDLYALGIVLYELLTGQLPFAAENPLAAAHRRMVAEPPAPMMYRHDIAGPLQDVVLHILRRDPSERPTSAAELRELLSWSRRRSPATPDGPPGGWLVPVRPPRPRVRSGPAGGLGASRGSGPSDPSAPATPPTAGPGGASAGLPAGAGRPDAS